ncbi:MAG: hypothetical protein WAT68_04565 [Candidatus Nitrotoga sp.]
MEDDKTKTESKSVLSTIVQHWGPPAVTALLGLIAGIGLSTYNSDLSNNRFFLEKRAVVADNIANEFSRYVVNWARLMQLRREFDAKKDTPSAEERENFKRTVFARNDARDKLFSSMDTAHLYYDDKTSILIVNFRDWDTQQATLTINKLPDPKEWRTWQVKILRQLHKEISNE